MDVQGEGRGGEEGGQKRGVGVREGRSNGRWHGGWARGSKSMVRRRSLGPEKQGCQKKKKGSNTKWTRNKSVSGADKINLGEGQGGLIVCFDGQAKGVTENPGKGPSTSGRKRRQKKVKGEPKGGTPTSGSPKGNFYQPREECCFLKRRVRLKRSKTSRVTRNSKGGKKGNKKVTKSQGTNDQMRS